MTSEVSHPPPLPFLLRRNTLASSPDSSRAGSLGDCPLSGSSFLVFPPPTLNSFRQSFYITPTVNSGQPPSLPLTPCPGHEPVIVIALPRGGMAEPSGFTDERAIPKYRSQANMNAEDAEREKREEAEAEHAALSKAEARGEAREEAPAARRDAPSERRRDSPSSPSSSSSSSASSSSSSSSSEGGSGGNDMDVDSVGGRGGGSSGFGASPRAEAGGAAEAVEEEEGEEEDASDVAARLEEEAGDADQSLQLQQRPNDTQCRVCDDGTRVGGKGAVSPSRLDTSSWTALGPRGGSDPRLPPRPPLSPGGELLMCDGVCMGAFHADCLRLSDAEFRAAEESSDTFLCPNWCALLLRTL